MCGIASLIGLVIGFAIGSLIGALIIQLVTRWICGFAPPYSMAYRACIFSCLAGLVISIALAIICGDIGGALDLLDYVISFFVTAGIFSLVLKDDYGDVISFGKACLISLVLVLIGVVFRGGIFLLAGLVSQA